RGSAVYAQLAASVARDDELLAVAREARAGQPLPNLFFSAVHMLLDDCRGDPLAEYYASMGGSRAPDRALDAAFRAFTLAHRDAVIDLMRTRLVQTNEVRRSVCLLPAFATISDASGGAPLALFEIGASAGLNLLFDRYGYSYNG